MRIGLGELLPVAVLAGGLLAGCEPASRRGGEGRRPSTAAQPLLGMIVVAGESGRAPFLLDRFEVTNVQFDEFLRETGYVWTHRDHKSWDESTRRLKRERGEHPVVQVTLDDARAYARWAGNRLPTFEEWVRAASAHGRHQYPWGDKSPEPYYANSLSARLHTTAPVGAFPEGRNASGAYDLVGNVWEWTETVPTYWAAEEPVLRKEIRVRYWYPWLLPGFDTTVRRDRLTVDEGQAIWFPALLPHLDTRLKVETAVDRVPVPYVGRGRLVVGGGFRNREIPNFRPGDVAGPIVFEPLEQSRARQGLVVRVQLLEPDEWRDDVGFRCVRDVGPEVVEVYLRALAAARGSRREPIEAALRAMGRERVGALLKDFDGDGDADLKARIRRLRDELNP